MCGTLDYAMTISRGTVPSATLVLLTLNEIEGTRRFLKELPFSEFQEVFCVDGGSTDGTRSYLEANGIRVLSQDRRGRGEAFRVAAKAAHGEHLVYFSPDGNEDPHLIVPLLRKLREGYDMAVASRFSPGGSDEDAHKVFPIRSYGNRFFSWVANKLWNRGPYLADTINGFRAVTKSAFFKMDPAATDFSIEIQMSIRAMKLGLRVAEIPTNEPSRVGGHSKANTFSAGLSMCRVFWQEFWKPAPP